MGKSWFDGPYSKDAYALVNVRAHEPLVLPWREEPAQVKRMPGHLENDWGVVLQVTPRWRRLASQELKALQDSSVTMRNLAGKINDPRTQKIGKLGEIGCWQYYLALGVDVIPSAIKSRTEAGYTAFDKQKDAYDILIHGIPFEIKTLDRPSAGKFFVDGLYTHPEQERTYLGKVSRRTSTLDPGEHFLFCSFVACDGEEYLQIFGWTNGWGLKYWGYWVPKGEKYPGDTKPQFANNWVIEYRHLMSPNTLR